MRRAVATATTTSRSITSTPTPARQGLCRSRCSRAAVNSSGRRTIGRERTCREDTTDFNGLTALSFMVTVLLSWQECYNPFWCYEPCAVSTSRQREPSMKSKLLALALLVAIPGVASAKLNWPSEAMIPLSAPCVDLSGDNATYRPQGCSTTSSMTSCLEKRTPHRCGPQKAKGRDDTTPEQRACLKRAG